MTLEFEADRRLPDGDFLAHPVSEDGDLVAETLLFEGRARLCLEEDALRHASSLKGAQLRARRSRAGVWARQAPARPAERNFHRGVALGLYAQSPEYDYTSFLDEIRDVGASHVLISSPWLMEDWQANESTARRGKERRMASARARHEAGD